MAEDRAKRAAHSLVPVRACAYLRQRVRTQHHKDNRGEQTAKGSVGLSANKAKEGQERGGQQGQQLQVGARGCWAGRCVRWVGGQVRGWMGRESLSWTSKCEYLVWKWRANRPGGRAGGRAGNTPQRSRSRGIRAIRDTRAIRPTRVIRVNRVIRAIRGH
jgi:hypothetical protein